MKCTLDHIAPVRAGAVAGVLYAFFGLLILPVYLILFMVEAGLRVPSLAVAAVFALGIPLLYGSVGFAATALSCWLYNVIAGRAGGIQYTSSVVE